MNTSSTHPFEYKSISSDAQDTIVKALQDKAFSLEHFTSQQILELREDIMCGHSPMEVISEQLVYILALILIEGDGERQSTQNRYFTEQAIKLVSEFIDHSQVNKIRSSYDMMVLLYLSKCDLSLFDQRRLAQEILQSRNQRFYELLTEEKQ